MIVPSSGERIALSMRDLRKAYPGVVALDAVSLDVSAGQVHGIVGENGAGKSTLMKTIAGAVTPDEGTVLVDGAAVPADVHAASAAGIAMIYQELTIIPELTACDNVFLGDPPRSGVILSRRRARARFREIGQRLGVDIAPGARAGSLSTSAQQLLEIMRALARDRRIVVMDEPTASLGPADIERLHGIIRDLRSRGVTVLYVSHDLDAVLDVCDTVSVMRAGRMVATAPAAEWTHHALVTEMVGAVSPPEPRAPRDQEHPVVLDVRGVRGPGVDLPDLTVRAGEIVGLAGLVGSGRSRLLTALAGAGTLEAGSMSIDRRPVAWPRSPRAAARIGIVLAPEDRKAQGLVLDRASSWNVAIGAFARAAGAIRVTRRRIARWAKPFATRAALPEHRLAVSVGTLSGGNQQKVLLARQISREPRLLLLDEPTRGIDVGAKAQVFGMLRSLADEGLAIVWASSELEEVARYSDRVIVLAQGRAVAELPGGCDVHDILTHSFSQTHRKAAA
ncbi:sugar ABC transporter ATP-binding protein [Microbacterium sp. SLBN-146]|uniref:sugar ABC transporter ATP-binding protein n=1 Tax=Microbacterium sp. SLBN-146 TaxID=2768457 RepID=UPI00114DC068|nr:sugar ABC transporter ATP-binding protein [Microbacterium sp. SLBN-146]TQJ31490.1 ribose transport system ATP-binding protein [Microbacterium sp. SLBN-146]